METNVYTLEILVRERLTDARAAAARRALVPQARRRTLRAAVGTALIAAGTRLIALEPRRCETHA